MSGVVCGLCPHSCRLSPGQKGLCGVRENIDGRIVSLTYGKFSAINLDPIEKKPLYHVFPGSKTLSLGSIGCNLRCPWCQNYHISRERSTDNLHFLKVEDLLNLTINRGLDSVTFTYNEPILNYEYIREASKVLDKHGIKTYLVTGGFISKEYYNIIQYISGVNIDLKSFSHITYKDYIKGDLVPVLEAIKNFSEATWTELTTLVIPGLNDSTEEIESMGGWIYKNIGPNIPVHLSAFFPTFNMTDRERTPLETLVRLRSVLKKIGLNYVYIGNVRSCEGSSTICPQCSREVIIRDGFSSKSLLKKGGGCPHCSYRIPGLF